MTFLFSLITVETALLLGTLAILIRFYVNRKWQVLKKLHIPHNPPSIKRLGNILDNAKDPEFVFKNQLSNKKKFGKIYGEYNGLNAQITVADPEILKQIFIKEFAIFYQRLNIFKKINGKELNNGVNVVGGEQWKRIRSTLSPAFSSSKLKEMFGIFEDCTDHTVARLQKLLQEHNGRFDSKEIFSRLSLDVICSAAFSTNVNAQTDDNRSNAVLIKAKQAFDFSVVGKPWFVLILMFPWFEKILALMNYSIFSSETISYFGGLVDHLIQTRKDIGKHRTDLMQVMLQAKIPEKNVKDGARKGLTRNEIIGNSMIMLLAGYETTSNAMVFLTHSLATHQLVQEKIYHEIQDAIEKHGKLNYEAVTKMKYLDMCVNESLRLYGAVPRNSRYAEKDITINGVHIPKGTTVIVPTYGLAHDEEYWDKPFEFNPDRMEDMSKIDPIVFQPFGAGPRNCIGMRFALLEIKVAICKILQEFKVEACDDTPPPPLEMTFKASMKPKEDVFLRITKRVKAV